MNAIVKEASPDSIVIQGGIIPTVILETTMRDPNVDYCIVGEDGGDVVRAIAEFYKT